MNTIDDTSKRGESSEKDERLRFTLSSSSFRPPNFFTFFFFHAFIFFSPTPLLFSLSLSSISFFLLFPFPPETSSSFSTLSSFTTSSLLFPSSFTPL